MTDRQWHTAAPAPPQRQQENIIPQGNTILGLNPKYQDKLVSLIRLLHKHGNPQSTARGQDSDLTLLMDYENTYGNGPQTRFFAAHPERHAYKMMAALATGDDVRAWLAEWRHRGLDLGPFDKVDFFAPDALVVHQPDGMTRHLHATAAGGNRGRPRILANGLVDPYWGTGLDPAHVSGFVAPYRSALAPYMACCGQELGKNGEIPPGCWIPLEAGQSSGRLVPYQVWFQQMKAADIWQSIVSGTASASFMAATKTGTAFLDRAYYRELDRQIRALVATVVPAIVNLQLNALQTAFVDNTVRGLSSHVRAQICELVSLVDQYNGPQMGAGRLSTLCDDAFLANQICFLAAGQSEFAAGRLQQEVEIAPGVKLPKLYNMTGLKPLITRVQAIVNPSAAITSFLTILRRVDNDIFQWETSWRVGAKEQMVELDRLVQYWMSFHIARLDFMQEQKKTLVEKAVEVVDNHIKSFPVFYNAWLANTRSDLQPFLDTLHDTESNVVNAMQKLPNKRDLISFHDALKSPSDAQVQAFIADPTKGLVGYGHLSAVTLYARFVLAVPGMIAVIPSTRAAITQAQSELEQRARAAVDQAKRQPIAIVPQKGQQILQILERFINDTSTTPQWFTSEIDRVVGSYTSKWEKLKFAMDLLVNPTFRPYWEQNHPGLFFVWLIEQIEDGSRVLSQWESEFGTRLMFEYEYLWNKFNNGAGWNRQNPVNVSNNVRLQMQASVSTPDLGWNLRGFTFNIASCAYDALFPALFKVRGQWLQREIREAGVLYPLRPECTSNHVLDFHQTMVDEITYMEGRQQGPPRCVNINQAWIRCIPTKDTGSTYEDDPMLMLDALLEFYDLKNRFEIFQYGQLSSLALKPQTEMVMIQAFDTQPNRNIPLKLGNGTFTLLSCLAYYPGHWRAYVREPNSARWVLFDSFYEGADGKNVTEPRNDPPSAVTRNRVENYQQTGDPKTVVFTPRAWIYVKMRMPSSLSGGGGGTAPIPLNLRLLSMTCPTRANADCGTLVLREFFQRVGVQPQVTYQQIRDYFKTITESNGDVWSDDTQINEALLRGAVEKWLPNTEVDLYYMEQLAYGSATPYKAQRGTIGGARGNPKLTIPLALLIRASRNGGAGHYFILEMTRWPLNNQEIEDKLRSEEYREEQVDVPLPTGPSGGSGGSTDLETFLDAAFAFWEKNQHLIPRNIPDLPIILELLANEFIQDPQAALNKLTRSPDPKTFPAFYQFTPANILADFGASSFIAFFFTMTKNNRFPVMVNNVQAGLNTVVKRILLILFKQLKWVTIPTGTPKGDLNDPSSGLWQNWQWVLKFKNEASTKLDWPRNNPAEVWPALLRLIALLYRPIDQDSRRLFKQYYRAVWPL